MSAPGDYAIGIDLGTSGCRAIAVDLDGGALASARVALPPPLTPADGWVEQDPRLWWDGVLAVLRRIGTELAGCRPVVIAVDGTSSTLLLADPDGTPKGSALMYNDRRATGAAAQVDRAAPPESPARGAGSSLSKLIYLAGADGPHPGTLALHQADWIGGRLAGRFGWSDWNNALKLGYDAERLTWPDWVLGLIPRGIRLPQVLAPGATAGYLTPGLAEQLGLAQGVRVAAGTTDSTAAVIAAGACRPGDAVTCLGSTLVLKIVSQRPVTSTRHGVYSHRFGDLWLVGGASNSGGAVLRRFFDDAELAALSQTIDPDRPSGLDYYPLPRAGERFPRHDPGLEPRIWPVPPDRQRFLQGLLEGMARIEAEGYALLTRLGAPCPTRVLTTGGGSGNQAWEAIRRRALGLPVIAAAHQEAAQGAALLALGRA
jgi:hypothetical protein